MVIGSKTLSVTVILAQIGGAEKQIRKIFDRLLDFFHRNTGVVKNKPRGKGTVLGDGMQRKAFISPLSAKFLRRKAVRELQRKQHMEPGASGQYLYAISQSFF